ncbi:hypothetical protein EYR36_008797 [Pleurotus pulmonarius]|nr:hypothetical protein EYR36_008797 [Pleurotus pulmonarius]
MRHATCSSGASGIALWLESATEYVADLSVIAAFVSRDRARSAVNGAYGDLDIRRNTREQNRDERGSRRRALRRRYEKGRTTCYSLIKHESRGYKAVNVNGNAGLHEKM